MKNIKKMAYENDDELKIGDVVIAVTDVDDEYPTRGLVGVVIGENNLVEYPLVHFGEALNFGVFCPIEDDIDGGCLNVEYFEVMKLVVEE